MRRHSEPSSGANDAPCCFGRQIVLADVQAVKPGGEAEGGAGVDDELDVCPQTRPEFARLGELLPGVARLVAILEQRNPGGSEFFRRRKHFGGISETPSIKNWIKPRNYQHSFSHALTAILHTIRQHRSLLDAVQLCTQTQVFIFVRQAAKTPTLPVCPSSERNRVRIRDLIYREPAVGGLHVKESLRHA